MFTQVFSIFGIRAIFLEDSRSFVYKIDDLSHKEIYLKMKLVSFLDSSRYINGVVPSYVAERKQRKWYIKTHLLVDIDSKEAR